MDDSLTPSVISTGQIDLETEINIAEKLFNELDCFDIQVLIVRVVHGGYRFQSPIKVNDENLLQLKELVSLAPLHNKVSIDLIEQWRKRSGLTQIFAVFDTEFFANLPDVAKTYGLPRLLIEKHQIRRFGFHGFAHQGMLKQWQLLNPNKTHYRIVTAQLGSGCSMAAIQDGQPVDISMGFTPNEGLLMRTRCGDVDPGLVTWLQVQEGYSPDQANGLLNGESGWFGLSGGVGDMAEIFTSNSPEEKLAFNLFRYRFQKTIGAYFAILGGLDGVVLSGGIAENNAEICCVLLSDLSHLGITIRNDSSHGNLPLLLSTQTSKVDCLIVDSEEVVSMIHAVKREFQDIFGAIPKG